MLPPNNPEKTDVIICNPANQVAFLDPNFTPSVVQNGATATVTLSPTQFDQVVTKTPNKGIGYNIGQPETNWVGNISATNLATSSVSVNVQTPSGPFTQMNCPPGCNAVNTDFENSWFLSNVPYGQLPVPMETTGYLTAGARVLTWA